ncbi:unnamed protein product [Caenorhabditis bovis]|uniref:Uncharacterized protein n=1 Tax=Caenorhabditis bovis TaxID=2654633 RepID=A0A8S1FCV7_9PELO|nr:unnamed protein product [Caenorhabditis bovis]
MSSNRHSAAGDHVHIGINVCGMKASAWIVVFIVIQIFLGTINFYDFDKMCNGLDEIDNDDPVVILQSLHEKEHREKHSERVEPCSECGSLSH